MSAFDMSYRTITAFYRDRDDAEEAVSALAEAGLSRDHIRLVPGKEPTSTTTDTKVESQGFWDSLADFFFPDDDRQVYAEGLRRGGYLVTVNVSDDLQHQRALDILDDEGSIDVDEWSDSWRAEGWTPTNPGFDREDTRLGSDDAALGSLGTRRDTSASGSFAADYADRGQGDVIPIVEENVRVGKRDVNNGRVRVRSYVVETPVSETVNLRDENVSVERRAVDRPVTDADAAFRERTIEAEEHREEAVIAKEARVKEELVVKKSETERTEQVEDSVRRTEVEIEDDRDANARGTGTSGTTDSGFVRR